MIDAPGRTFIPTPFEMVGGISGVASVKSLRPISDEISRRRETLAVPYQDIFGKQEAGVSLTGNSINVDKILGVRAKNNRHLNLSNEWYSYYYECAISRIITYRS